MTAIQITNVAMTTASIVMTMTIIYLESSENGDSVDIRLEFEVVALETI